MIYIYVLLLRIVAYLEGPAKIISFVIVFGLIAYSTVNKLKPNELTKIKKYNFYAIVISLMIMIHALIFGTVYLRDVAVILTYWIWLVFTYTHFKDKTIQQCLKYILISFFIFNLVNYIYFKMYFADQKIGVNSILSMLGIFDYRIYFPLSSGANVYAAQLAFNALIVLHFIKQSKVKIIYALIYTFYILMLVLADSRLLLLLTLIFSFIYWFSLGTIVRFFRKFWWAFAIALFAFLYVFYNTDLFDTFKRDGEKAGQSLSRIQIWSLAIDVIFSDIKILTGHGLNGFESALPETFQETFKDQHLQTSHNFVIQNIIDFGIIGIVIILSLVFQILKMLARLKSSILNTLIVMILLIGVTESIPTFYSFEATIFFIAILSIILTQNERKNTGVPKSSDVLS